MNTPIRILLAGCLLSSALTASAQIIRLGADDFTAQASVITFSEYVSDTQNPSYTLSTASLGNVTVSFGPRFVGQSFDGSFPVTLTGNPTGPLALDLSESYAFITGDGSNPTSPVLSGRPTFNGPISVLFSTPVAAVGLDGGYFDAIGGTAITAFNAAGAALGTVMNTSLGIEFFGLSTLSGANTISGISFYITGDEPAGFAIDNLTFGSAREVIHNGAVPEPSTYGLLGALALMAGVVVRRRLRK